MTVLVTGGAGYIGSHMVWKLLEEDEDVVVIDRLSTGFDWAIPAEVELVVGDIADQDLVEQTMKRRKVDAVIHFAGSAVVPDSLADPLGYYLNNTVKSRAMMESAIRAGVPHFIFSSTAAVYGGNHEKPVVEETPTFPESPYGRSKLMTEAMLADAAAAHPFTYTALRYFNVAGADPKGRTGQSTRGATHLIKVACETATGKRPFMEVFGTDYPTPDGTCLRDFIHVWDLVEAHLLALRRLRAGGKSLVANCGYGTGYSVLQVIEAVRSTVGRDFDVRYSPRRSGDLIAVLANADRARQEFGWTPKLDNLVTIVSDALRWEEALKRRNS
ncbi:UDP-glucose 4-epimerase GalE [Mesorhizobium sp. LHD-90]|uniref:UDP-glucose 4-epimerase GalE n=1 Tax=Mesorhizobium sp. LHD-90 TaxID=3071414 RepID=UPI0027DEB91F|nr:UDP-glucose 4-epimerase GalE [Mesorhizobium sp. LHD-90]MDQ6437603.1 UDP-glucose 4-epimerase GalE [Mesorhizobium sp. LHD-90]